MGQTADAEATLRQATQIIEQISDPIAQANIMAASGILAGLKLKPEVIYSLLKRDIMKESTIYQSIYQEGEANGEAKGEARGEARGEAKGEAKKQREIATNFLRDGFPVETVARGTGLSIEEVQQLQQQISESA